MRIDTRRVSIGHGGIVTVSILGYAVLGIQQ
jgi:hypothetical protein